jgi:hypothetical protein
MGGDVSGGYIWLNIKFKYFVYTFFGIHKHILFF